MATVRIVAVLLAIALVLVVMYLVTRKRTYLTWSWRVFVAALVAALGLMTFYFFERVIFGP